MHYDARRVCIRDILDHSEYDIKVEACKEQHRLAVMEEALEQGLAQGLAQGRQEGRLEGERILVLRQVQHRFGEVPDAVRQRVQSASRDELEIWADRILDAESLNEVFR